MLKNTNIYNIPGLVAQLWWKALRYPNAVEARHTARGVWFGAYLAAPMGTEELEDFCFLFDIANIIVAEIDLAEQRPHDALS